MNKQFIFPSTIQLECFIFTGSVPLLEDKSICVLQLRFRSFQGITQVGIL
jgi:hypothetical protein